MMNALLALILGVSIASAEPILVVFDMEDQRTGLGSRALKKLSESMAGLLGECGHQVIPPSQIPGRLRKLTRAVPRKRMTQARLLKASRTLVSSVRKKHSYCRIDAFLLDTHTGERVETANCEADCSLEALENALPSVAGQLCEHLQAAKSKPAEKPQDVGGTLDDAISAMEEIAGLKTRVAQAPSRGGLARVTIVSDPPQAEVSWDGKLKGKAPVTIDGVKPGRYRLGLDLAGHAPWRETVAVRSSMEMTISLFLSRREVLVKSKPPGARLYVNGDRKGRSPVKVTLPAGQRHEIRASLDEHEDAFMEFVAKPASARAPPQEVTVELTPKPVYLMLDVSPARARVTIGEGDRREQLVGSGTIGVIPGKRKIVAELDGYQTLTREVTIPVGKPYELKLRLKRVPAYFEYQDALGSKRLQAWSMLCVSVVALSASGPMIKWSLDSGRAADEWTETAIQAPNDEEARAAKAKSQEAEDRATWTGIVGYGAATVGVLALGWSLYSFLTYPDKPPGEKAAVVISPTRNGGQLLLNWQF